MGARASKFVARNVTVEAGANFDRDRNDGEVHMLIVALDYKKTTRPLTCSIDGKFMEEFAAECGVQDVVAMYDEQCTKPNLLAAIQQMGERCGENDYFVFFYSGHGAQEADDDGDEEDGQDEVFCLVNEHGKIFKQTCLRDDEFAEALTSYFDPDVRIIVLTDCCHSSSMCDFEKEDWAGRQAVSLSACLDEQTSEDVGKGGVFTHSMFLAVDQLQDAEEDDYSVGMLFNAMLDCKKKVFAVEQETQLNAPLGFSPDEMAWPLIPQGEYKAPLAQAAKMAEVGDDGDHTVNLAFLEKHGIRPHIIDTLDAAGMGAALYGDDKVDPAKLLRAGLLVGYQMRAQCWHLN